uniref:Maf-like protein n=1 Tax=Meloidogyne javanica TaxID=6303 RepID=A0A915MHE0_MELJA
MEGKLIGKPLTNNDAFNILKSLDGRKHQVRTGICLINRKGKKIVFSVETEVEFGRNGDKLIRNYINTGEAMNRAGAYAIQGKGAALIKAVYGSYTNVVGIPLNELIEKIKEILY